jgi:acetyl-CoA acetyltransferase
MIDTAENVVARFGISAAEQNEVALARYVQYQDALTNDRAFQRRYMIDVPITNTVFLKDMGVLSADEGIFTTTAEGLAKLKPVKPNGTVTFGSQTHPADGNAGMIVTTQELAREVSSDPKIEVELLGFGQARVTKGHMPMAVAPASQVALRNAGLTIKDVDAVKTHNPFAVNDITFARETGFPLAKMNNYGCSLIWGHPQGPTGMRSVIELIEELVLRGGGVGLFGGCAAGDSAMAVVLRVTG